MTCYVASVSYPIDGGSCVYRRDDFIDVRSATLWALERIDYLVLHWADIDDNGFKITATVESDDGDFCDRYEIKCCC